LGAGDLIRAGNQTRRNSTSLTYVLAYRRSSVAWGAPDAKEVQSSALFTLPRGHPHPTAPAVEQGADWVGAEYLVCCIPRFGLSHRPRGCSPTCVFENGDATRVTSSAILVAPDDRYGEVGGRFHAWSIGNDARPVGVDSSNGPHSRSPESDPNRSPPLLPRISRPTSPAECCSTITVPPLREPLGIGEVPGRGWHRCRQWSMASSSLPRYRSSGDPSSVHIQVLDSRRFCSSHRREPLRLISQPSLANLGPKEPVAARQAGSHCRTG
jgi:hypothetical protein